MFKYIVPALLLPALVACGPSNDTAVDPSPTVTVTADPYTTSPSTGPRENAYDDRDQKFIDLARTLPSVGNSPDKDIFDLADTICLAFDNNATFGQIIQAIVSAGWTETDAGGMIGLSVAYACPEYEGEFSNA